MCGLRGDLTVVWDDWTRDGWEGEEQEEVVSCVCKWVYRILSRPRQNLGACRKRRGRADSLWVDLAPGFALVGRHVRKVAPRLLLIVAGPIVVFGLLEGALYLTGRFELSCVAR